MVSHRKWCEEEEHAVDRRKLRILRKHVRDVKLNI